ncbi:MAG: hemolysin family protein [Ruminiclostridium sp.]
MDSDGRKHKKTAKEILLFPLIALEKGLKALLKKALGDGFDEVTEDDIMSMIDAGNESGTIEDNSAEMISNVFEFSDLNASDVMTHRINITGVDIDSDLEDIIYLALDKGFSRIPVYRGSIDTIIGIVIVKDLLCLVGEENLSKFSIKDFLRDVVFIPESCSCSDTFKYLTNMKTGMAVVVDEYGGTAGIVTLEDLIEAVMGNIQDEYDDEDSEINKIGKEKYEVDGEADPEDVLELFGLELPEDHEYDTIAGFVTDLLGYIPENVDKPPHVDYKNIRFVITQVEDNRIIKIIAIKMEDADEKTEA